MPRMGRIPAAEAMPVEDETRQFIQQVRRTTRRKLTAEEKVRSCWRASGARPGCQTSAAGEGINPNVYYAWLREFMEAGKTRLAAETVRDATQLEVASLKRDNERPKQLVAELSLEVLVLKKKPPSPSSAKAEARSHEPGREGISRRPGARLTAAAPTGAGPAWPGQVELLRLAEAG